MVDSHFPIPGAMTMPSMSCESKKEKQGLFSQVVNLRKATMATSGFDQDKSSFHGTHAVGVRSLRRLRL